MYSIPRRRSNQSWFSHYLKGGFMKRFMSQKAYLVCMVIMSVFVSILSGCGGGGGGSWTEPAKSPLTVTSTVPLNVAIGVAINSNLTATFSEEMNPATLITPATSFTLKEFVSGTNVAGVVTYIGNTATFNPNSDLLTNTRYSATITTVAKTPAGKTLAANFTWTFTTGLLSDTTAPTLLTTGAFDGETGLPINRNSTATFSEPMDPATLISPATTFTLKEFVSGANVAGTVTYIGNTATFNPTSDLKPNTKYTSTITTGAKDLAGNALVSGIRPNPWSWTTGAAADIVAPTITATSPLHLETNVPINKKINATFSEEMRQTTIITTNFTVKETLSGNPVTGTIVYTILGNMATFSPLADLKPDTDYTVTVTNGALDLAGNPLVVPAVGGLPKPNPWTFRTAAAVVPPPALNISSFGIAATAGVRNTGSTTINGNAVLDPSPLCNSVQIDGAGGFGLCGGSPPIINGQVISPLYPDAGITSGVIKAQLLAEFLSITPPAGPPAAGSLGGGINLPAGTTLGAPTGSALVQGDNLFVPGVYQSLTSIMITGDITLDAQGNPNGKFYFQSSSTVGTADGAASPGAHTRILLINGAKASNVFWQAGSAATLGTNSDFHGNILASADITMKTGATSCGRLLAGAFTAGAFVFDSNVVSVPGNVNAPPSCQ
jgi:hypothetical protein